MARSYADHPITVTPYPGEVKVVMKEDPSFEVARTTAALALDEAGYPRVFYVPQEDVEMAFLTPTEKSTHCPHKGDASYFSVFHNGILAENGVWTYEVPSRAVSRIAGHLAFDTRHFDVAAAP